MSPRKFCVTHQEYERMGSGISRPSPSSEAARTVRLVHAQRTHRELQNVRRLLHEAQRNVQYLRNHIVQRDDNESSSNNKPRKCCICYTITADTAFDPCGHLFCEACARHSHAVMNTCPICRTPITKTLRVYHPSTAEELDGVDKGIQANPPSVVLSVSRSPAQIDFSKTI